MVPNKPDSVQKAQIIIYFVIFAETLRTTIIYFQLRSSELFLRLSQSQTTELIIKSIISFILSIVFVYFIGKRKRLARNIFLIFFILGLPDVVGSFFMPAIMPFFLINNITRTVAAIATAFALVLLFKSPAKEWFNSKAEDIRS